MSDAASTAPQESALVSGAAPEAMTAGRLIAARRAQAGIHLAAVAATLKVPMHKLEALEADRYDAFPDTVFLRALASSVCRVLKSDPAPVLALLPRNPPAALESRPDLNARFKESGGTGGGGGTSRLPMSRAMAFTVIALLAAALVLAFLPRDGAEVAQPEAGSTEPLQLPEASVAAVPAIASTAAPEEQETPAPRDAPAPAATSDDAAGTQSAATPADAPASPAPDEPLVIQAREQTWVQIRDASGTILLEKTLRKGDRFAAQGSGPWSVVIGRADAADVVVRGQVMDLMGIARSNVARFEVK
ncbi:MAG: hypothetical protein BGO13_15185 [Burkholderiales bacterium 66-5]|uniref:helix-turn-helix domain-containing protein n=1 Tax=Comamonas badia TaxID=265291 RepID=UPI0004649ABB|nr:RodZ domain-containing protein [Comamonas badia]OJU87184.1 MAG: hypothetical protein BGO13_15185 [Burkholderiales bacterium 66-5]